MRQIIKCPLFILFIGLKSNEITVVPIFLCIEHKFMCTLNLNSPLCTSVFLTICGKLNPRDLDEWHFFRPDQRRGNPMYLVQSVNNIPEGLGTWI